MSLPINALAVASTVDLKHGDLCLTSTGSWAIRSVFSETYNTYEGLLHLTGEKAGEFKEFEQHGTCLTINRAAGYHPSIESIGQPSPPSESIKKGSMAIYSGGNCIVSRLRDAIYSTNLDGQETAGINAKLLFHYENWQVSLRDETSNTVGDEPLFRVQAVG
ncbi:hypothetical protein U2S91_09405 [Stenotrophomonas maltophilia]|nr:hypothetical protein [Stenotrophomonas maltophilia]WQI22825.1 hypothetical protein U2S91_09405 [Stenotrophomonas maltophilia]